MKYSKMFIISLLGLFLLVPFGNLRSAKMETKRRRRRRRVIGKGREEFKKDMESLREKMKKETSSELTDLPNEVLALGIFPYLNDQRDIMLVNKRFHALVKNLWKKEDEEWGKKIEKTGLEAMHKDIIKSAERGIIRHIKNIATNDQIRKKL